MPRLADPRKLTAWRQRFERFSKSGLAVVPFCEREGVSPASFYYWRKKLRFNRWTRSAAERHSGPRGRPTDRRLRLRSGPAEGRGRFQQVAVIPGTSPVPATALATSLPGGMVCIRLPFGTRIEVSAEGVGALRAVIAEVVRADRGLEGLTAAFGGQMMRPDCAWEAAGRADCDRGVGAASC
jgi:hypothetical protein